MLETIDMFWVGDMAKSQYLLQSFFLSPHKTVNLQNVFGSAALTYPDQMAAQFKVSMKGRWNICIKLKSSTAKTVKIVQSAEFSLWGGYSREPQED